MSRSLAPRAAFVLSLLLGGRFAWAAAPKDAPAKPLCPGCSIVFVSFDAVQAAHVSALGAPRKTTPTIDSFARRGVLFTQAVSAASWTLPASMSWFTGAYPSQHRVVNKFTEFSPDKQEIANLRRLSPDMKTLAQVLQGDGYATGGFTGDAGVNGMFGFNAGFDVYSDSVPPFSGFDRSVPKALAWARGVKDRKFFLFLHGYDAHGQHLPAGGYDRRYADPKYAGPFDGSPAQQRDLRERGLTEKLDLTPADVAFWRALYDEKIARADAEFSLFVASMTEMGALDRAVVVLVSDHGTEFFEHGKMDHGATLYDELLRVPLIVVVPGLDGGKALAQQVSTLDLMPTLLDIVGVAPGDAVRRQMAGRSLVPLIAGRASDAEDVLSETDYRLFTRKRSLRTADGWKFIATLDTGERELYRVSTDPGETKNLAKKEPRRAYEMEQTLFRRYKAMGVDLDLTPETGKCLPVYGDQCR